jgi:hypothetical protein
MNVKKNPDNPKKDQYIARYVIMYLLAGLISFRLIGLG